MISNWKVRLFLFCYASVVLVISDCKCNPSLLSQKPSKQCDFKNFFHLLESVSIKQRTNSGDNGLFSVVNLKLKRSKVTAHINPFHDWLRNHSLYHQCKKDFNAIKKPIEVLGEPSIIAKSLKHDSSKINVNVDLSGSIENCTATNRARNESKSKDITTDFGNQTDHIQIQISDHIEEIPIPVFSEWAQKQMEAAEKLSIGQESIKNSFIKKTVLDKKNNPLKSRSKNYASPDCGAKIILSNSDSTNTAAVLTSSKDEYMLSPCGNRIWFIVELCEPVQAQKIELANFELFSSSPKNFTISVSNRFPTRDWQIVGQFIAEDKRNIQKFDLQPQLFGKFIRVDINSYYSKEHFCPVSLFRVFGTSEFEAFETENHPNEDIDDIEEEFNGEPSINKNQEHTLFKSASDVVISIVKKAAEALAKSSNSPNDTIVTHKSCVCSSLLFNNFTCIKCSSIQTDQVNQILHCQMDLLTKMFKVQIFREHLEKSKICQVLLLEIDTNITSKNVITVSIDRINFSLNFLPTKYILALCHLLENYNSHNLKNQFNRTNSKEEQDIMDFQNTQNKSCSNNFISYLRENIYLHRNLTFRFFKMNEQQQNQISISYSTNKTEEISDKQRSVEFNSTRFPKYEYVFVENVSHDNNASNENIFNNIRENENSINMETILETNGEDEVLKDLKYPDNNKKLSFGQNDEIVPSQPTTSNINGAPTQAMKNTNNAQTESVFIRLSNRVKALERNMSLSGQYLEELSRRYKKQVEDLQLILNQQTQKVLNIEESNRHLIKLTEYQERYFKDMEYSLNSLKLQVHACVAVIIFIGSVAMLILIVAILFYVSARHKNNLSPSNSTRHKADYTYDIQKSNENSKIYQKTNTLKRNYFNPTIRKAYLISDSRISKIKIKNYPVLKNYWKNCLLFTGNISLTMNANQVKDRWHFEKNDQGCFIWHRRKYKMIKTNGNKSIPITYKLVSTSKKALNKIYTTISINHYTVTIISRVFRRKRN